MKFLTALILITSSFCNLLLAQNSDEIPVHESFPIFSKNVGEKRTINVWTPPEYAQGKDSLAVLYMLDGGIKEDFPHIANTIAELIKSNKIEPLILVGIENTQRRLDLTGPTEVADDKKIAPAVGGSENFRKFLKEELIPYINKQYRTTSRKGIIGESLAGLFITETILLDAYIFDDYIAMDPSLWWNNHYLIRNAKFHLLKFPETPKKFWFAGSGAKDIQKYVIQLSDLLKAENFPNLEWHFSPEKKEQHNTIFRATKEKALIWTYGKNEAPVK